MYQYIKMKKGVKEILGDSISLYKQSFWMVLPLAIAVAIFSTLSFYKVYTNAAGELIWQQQLLWLAFEGLVLMISAFCISAIYIIMHFSAVGEKVTFNESITLMFFSSLKIAFATLLYVALLAIGFAFFIVPGLFLGILFIHYMPLILLNNPSILSAYKTSARLVWKHWWHSCIPVLVPFVYMAILLNVVGQLYPDA